MFVRNDTTCPFCGNCNTFDLFSELGLYRKEGLNKVGLALECVNPSCLEVIRFVCDPTPFLQIVKEATKSLTKGSHWYKSFGNMPEIRSMMPEEYVEYLKFTCLTAFRRNYVDRDLAMNPVLSALVSRVLDDFRDGEYNDSIVYIHYDSLSRDDQPLAS